MTVETVDTQNITGRNSFINIKPTVVYWC